MRFMNRWDIDRAVGMYCGDPVLGPARHPILGPACETLQSLMEWTDSHSDGWAYWPKPVRAAAKLIEMIERDGTWEFTGGGPRPDVTVAEYKTALRPLKTFRTKYGAEFDIVDAEIA